MATFLAMTMLMGSLSSGTTAFAKSKSPKFYNVTSKKTVKKSISTKKNRTIKIKIKNTKKSIRNLKSSKKKVASVKKIGKRTFRIRTKKRGTTKISMKVGAKKMTLTVNVGKKKTGGGGTGGSKNTFVYSYLPNGLYRGNWIGKNGSFTSTADGGFMYYVYNNVTYAPYRFSKVTSRATEVQYARNSQIFGQFFRDLDKWRGITGDNTLATLNAIKDYAVENHCVYQEGSSIYSIFLNHKGQCGEMSYAVSYLCYLAGIDSVIVCNDSANHAIACIKINGNWYPIEATDMMTQGSYMGFSSKEPVSASYYNSNGNLVDPYKTGYSYSIKHNKMLPWPEANITLFSSNKNSSYVMTRWGCGLASGARIPNMSELNQTNGNYFYYDFNSKDRRVYPYMQGK